MSLYEKLVGKGARVFTHPTNCDYHIIKYNKFKFYFKVSTRKDFEGKPETNYELIGINSDKSNKFYKANRHLRVYGNVILFREIGVNNAYTQNFLHSMWGKYILTSEDIYRFRREGFKTIIEF